MRITIDRFGRVLIPKSLRERLGFAPGTPLALDVHDAGDGAPSLEIRAIPDEPLLVRENGRLVFTGALDPFDLVEALGAQRAARDRRVSGLDAGASS